MKLLLSDAIRLGAMLGPQLFERFTDGQGGSCALGAGLLAVGAKFKIYSGESYCDASGYFPGISATVKGESVIPYKAAPYWDESVWHEIVYRNNVLHHTREQIADWLVESGNDCKAVTTAPTRGLVSKIIAEHTVAR